MLDTRALCQATGQELARSGPMPAEPHKLFLLQIFGARAAAELERLQFEERLRESEQRWRSLTEEITTVCQRIRDVSADAALASAGNQGYFSGVHRLSS